MKLIASLMISSALFAQGAAAAPFNAEELVQSSRAATDEFKAEIGQALYSSIYAIQASASSSGSKVKVFYKEGTENKTLEYFCHVHGADIDCHGL